MALADGLIAPAWLLGAEAERAVIDAGMSYTTTLRTVRDFASAEPFLAIACLQRAQRLAPT